MFLFRQSTRLIPTVSARLISSSGPVVSPAVREIICAHYRRQRLLTQFSAETKALARSNPNREQLHEYMIACISQRIAKMNHAIPINLVGQLYMEPYTEDTVTIDAFERSIKDIVVCLKNIEEYTQQCAQDHPQLGELDSDLRRSFVDLSRALKSYEPALQYLARSVGLVFDLVEYGEVSVLSMVNTTGDQSKQANMLSRFFTRLQMITEFTYRNQGILDAHASDVREMVGAQLAKEPAQPEDSPRCSPR